VSVREVVQYQITMTAQGAQTTAAAVKSVDASAKQVTAGIKSAEEAVKKSLTMMGGSFGMLGEVAFELTGKISGAAGAIGAMGAAAALSVVAVGALAFAGVQLAAAAFEAGERLEKAGLQAIIPKDAQASLDRYKDGTKGLRDEIDLLTVSMSGDLLTAVGDLSFALTGALDKLGKLRDAAAEKVGGDTGGGSMLRRVALGIGTLGASEVAGALSGAIQTQIADGERLNEIRATEAQLVKDGTAYMEREASARESVNQDILDGVDAERKLEEAKRRRAEADRESAKAAAEDAAALRAMQSELAKLAAEDAADSARIRAQMLAWNDAAIAAEATGAGIAAQAGAIDTSGLAAALNGGGGGIAAAALKGLPGMLSGGAGGVMSSLGAAGPVGAAIAAVVALPDIIDQIAGTVDGLVDMFEAFPEKLSKALTETLPGIIDAIPDLVVAIVEAVIALPGIIMEMVPELVSSIAALVPTLIGDLVTSLAENLPTMLADGLSSLLSGGLYGAILKGVWDGMNEALNGLPDKIAEAIGKLLAPLTKPFKDKEGDFLGTDLKAAKGEKKLFGINVPFFDMGTPRIQRGGLAVVHEGERISSVGEGRSGGSPINVTVVADSPRDMIRQMQGLLGPYGLGETLAGLGP
jgi:hypothetical protein